MTTRRPLVLIGGTPQELPTADVLPSSFAETVIAADSATTALRVTQTGTGDVLRVEDSSNPDSTPLLVTNSGAVGIGGTPEARARVQLASPITGSISSVGCLLSGAIQSASSSAGTGFQTVLATEAASFTLPLAMHFLASQGTIGAGSAVTTQYGFIVSSNLSGATTNIGYGSEISGAANWNLYILGSAPNHLAGNLGIGTSTISAKTHVLATTEQLRLGYDASKYVSFIVDANGNMNISPVGGLAVGGTANNAVNLYLKRRLSGSVLPSAALALAEIKSDATSGAIGYGTTLSTEAASFTSATVMHFYAAQGSIGAGSAITTQYGFLASNMSGASTNIAFGGEISGATNWNLYCNGNAANYLAGNLGIGASTISAKAHIVATTEQLRLGYDATKYVSYTVDSDGFQAFSGGAAETPVVANTSTAYTITAKSLHDLTLTGNCTFTFPTATAGRQFTLILNQDATGSRTVTWPSSVRWPGGTAPTVTATASKTDVFSFLAVGTYWLGFTGAQLFTRA